MTETKYCDGKRADMSQNYAGTPPETPPLCYANFMRGACSATKLAVRKGQGYAKSAVQKNLQLRYTTIGHCVIRSLTSP